MVGNKAAGNKAAGNKAIETGIIMIRNKLAAAVFASFSRIVTKGL
jgi:hypothetical protein